MTASLPENYEAELELFLKGLPEAGDDPVRKQHRARIAYWVREEQEALAELAAADGAGTRIVDSPLWSHPRVIKAVDVIERVTRQGEKVLVFGTFRAPMRALAQVLEVRHALRRIGHGLPVALNAGDRLGLAWRELQRMRVAGEDARA